MILGGGLVLLGIVVAGFLETLVAPHTLEQASTTGDVVVHTVISPTLRASLIALGLVIWLLYVLYRLANPRTGADSDTTEGREQTLDETP